MLTKLTAEEIKNLPPFGMDDKWSYYTYGIQHDWARLLSPEHVDTIRECCYISNYGADFYNPLYSGKVSIEAETREELNQKIKCILSCL